MTVPYEDGPDSAAREEEDERVARREDLLPHGLGDAEPREWTTFQLVVVAVFVVLAGLGALHLFTWTVEQFADPIFILS